MGTDNLLFVVAVSIANLLFVVFLPMLYSTTSHVGFQYQVTSQMSFFMSQSFQRGVGEKSLWTTTCRLILKEDFYCQL